MSVNKVILIGHVCAEPNVKNFENGGKLVTIKLATNKKFTSKEGIEATERTEYHVINVAQKLSLFVEKYVKKGTLMYIEGELQTKKYTGKDYIERYATYILAYTIQILKYPNQKSENTSDDFSASSAQPENGADGSLDSLPF